MSDKVNTVYFKDGHTEDILEYKILKMYDSNYYIKFYTKTGTYSYFSYFDENPEFERSRGIYMRTRHHVFQKYDNEKDNWFKVDIDRITLPND